jgi:hypothetical protein
VVGEWPPPPEEAERNLSLSLYLYNRHDARQPHFNRRAAGYPDVITRIDSLLLELAVEAFREGFTARIDASVRMAKIEPWPRWCMSIEQFQSVIRGIASRAAIHDPEVARIYPFSVWLLPPGEPSAEGRIELFRQLLFDESVMAAVFSSGVIYLSVTDAFCDITAGHAYAEQTLRWLSVAQSRLPDLQVSWKVEPA